MGRFDQLLCEEYQLSMNLILSVILGLILVEGIYCVKLTCKEPDRIGDGFCDDKNNNLGCNFDGGDCCPTYGYFWDAHCSECECKTDNDCEDKKSSKWCS